jgi:hypothetical protein
MFALGAKVESGADVDEERTATLGRFGLRLEVSLPWIGLTAEMFSTLCAEVCLS